MTDDVLYELDTNNGGHGSKIYVSLPRTYKVTLGPGVPGSRGGMQWMFRAYEDAAKKNCVLATPALGYRRSDVAVIHLSNKDNGIKGHFARMEQAQATIGMVERTVVSDNHKAAGKLAAMIGLPVHDGDVF